LGSNQLNATASVPGAFTYSPTNGAVLTVGTNTLSVTFAPTDATDYNSLTTSVSLVVQPAPLTVTAGNTTRAYGVTNPVFTGTITGLTNGDNIAVAYACVATPTSPPGTYPIVPSLVDPADLETNYTVSMTNGTLTVTAALLTVTGVAPDAGLTNGGTSVTIFGTGFAAGASVIFGGLPASSVNVINSTNLTAVAPPSTFGAVSLLVTNADGQAVLLTNAFIYVTPPVVRAITPSAGAISLAWSATAGQTYQVQFTTNLWNVSWTDLLIITATNSITTVSDPVSSAPQRFYRAIWVP
jgi:hypothetical protein